MENENFNINEIKEIKVILLGDSGVGKTNLINVAVGIKFQEMLESTCSSSFVTKHFIKQNTRYTLNIWDTAGQENFRAMTKLFIKNSKIVIFVYAIDNKNSFNDLNYWISTTQSLLGEEALFAIAGNKSDLYMNEKVKQKEAKDLADKIGAKFKIVSAKINAKGFIDFLEELLDDYIDNKECDINDESFEIKKENFKKKSLKKKCCS